MTKTKIKPIVEALSKIDWTHIFDGAAVISYYLLFSLFPALIVLVSTVAYLPISIQNTDLAMWLAMQAPEIISDLIIGVLNEVTKSGRLGFLSVGFFVALWTISSGVLATIRQINISYQIEENRSFLKLRLISILLSVAIGAFLLTPVLINAVVFILNYLSISSYPLLIFQKISSVKHLFYLLFIFVFFSMLYLFGPNKKMKFKEIAFGAFAASLLFTFSTFLFEFYLSNFASYSVIYGSLTAVIALMIWFYILGFLILIGVEFNHCYLKLKARSSQ